jgi:hypothetical protein
MILDEVSKESLRTAVKNDPFHLLLEIERCIRAEERKDHCQRAKSALAPCKYSNLKW